MNDVEQLRKEIDCEVERASEVFEERRVSHGEFMVSRTMYRVCDVGLLIAQVLRDIHRDMLKTDE